GRGSARTGRPATPSPVRHRSGRRAGARSTDPAVLLHRASVSTPRTGGRVPPSDPLSARGSLGPGLPDYYRLSVLADRVDLQHAPVTIRILLENVLRNAGNGVIGIRDVETLCSWRPGQPAEAEIPFMPARVILQDFT